MASAFLKIPDVRGGASDPQHLGWIEALSFSRAAHNPTEFSITKDVDSSSALLGQLSQAGKPFEAEIDAVNQGRIVMHLGLKGAAIVAMQITGRGSAGAPVESLTLACQSVEVEVR